MSPNGNSIVPPTKQAGALWEATVELSNEQTRTFQLYLTRLGSHSGALGMIFDNDKREWVRLQKLHVEENLAGQIELRFEHPVVIWVELNGRLLPMERIMIYSATTAPSENGVFTPLEGTVRTDLMISGHPGHRWTASRNLKVGLWKADILSEDVHLAIRNWEGELFGPFQLKYLIGSVSWEPRRASTTWTGSTLNVSSVSSWNLVRPLSLNASLAGTSLSGTAQMRGITGFTSSFSWTANRVQEDIDF